ncbi:MAG TPA: hypothetical protein VN026_03615 [Bacteroidia bacterium]|jgi:hypothetical protein|nr:hypothetical protein [Bacteroidia bacterium]
MKTGINFKIRFVAPLLCCTLFSFSQKQIDPDKIVAFNVTVNFDDYTVKTQMLKDPQKVKIDNELIYLWYNSNKIMETRGGYDGKLLHGYYKSFYPNNQLRESGQINYGTKHKEWRYWYSNGTLKEVSNWKNGRKNGKYELYNDYGRLMGKGYFKNDLLHGKFYTYDNFGHITNTRKYKNGIEIVPDPEKQRSKGIFKRKKKSSNTDSK